MNMKIRIKEVEFSYSSTRILDGISLNLEKGFVCILGQNGVGKSTLIHCINCLLKPQSGEVTIDETSVAGMTLKEIARKVGYVPQAATDVFALSVLDTVMMGRHPHTGWNTGEEDLRIAEGCLATLGIEHLAMRMFDELSAGQKQKVMIARGLAQGTDMIMLDEPTSNLDIRHQLEVMDILADLVKTKGLLVIMVSHDLNMTARYADQVIMLKSGKIFAAGSPDDVFTEDNIKEVYGVEAEVVRSHNRPYIIPLVPIKMLD